MRPPNSVARYLLVLLILLAALPGAARASTWAPPTYVDKRVTGIPASLLLTLPGAKLVDARRQRVAQRLNGYRRPLFFFWALSQIVALFVLWAAGYAARWRDVLKRRIEPVFGMRFAYGASLALVAGLAALPASLARYRLDLAFGLTTQSRLGWLADGVLNATLDALLVGAIVASIFALVDRTRLWYVYSMAGLSVLTLAMAFLEPVIVAPLYNRFTPLAAHSAVRRPLATLAERAGIRGAPLFVADDSRRTRVATADVSGFGPTTRIVLSDALLSEATTGEVLFLAAREFGHYAHGDDLRLSLFWTFLLMFCTALAVVVADRVGFRRDDDPLARLALVFAFLGLLGLAETPLYNAYSRNLESRADSYALALTRDRPSAVRAYVRIADETFASLCPPRLVRLYFYNTPPMGTRIARAASHHDPCR